jgi:RimJ/RimL family protein N-acetyltransferase
MQFEMDEVLIRKWRKYDAPRLAEIANNKYIFDNLRDAIPYPYNERDAEEYISMALDADDKTHLFAIEFDKTLVGSIGGFIKEDIYRKSAEIGYYLEKEYWGRGIMTKAIKILTNYLLNNFDLLRLYAEPFERNIGSKRALEKAGFSLEATIKCGAVKNDIVEDYCIYSLLSDKALSHQKR